MKSKVKKILEASYQNPNEAKQSLQKMGYVYDDSLSTPESKVFLDRKGRPNIAFRGSKRIFDDFLGSDLKLAFGLENYDRRFQEAKHLTKLVEDKYHQPVNVFGHSLGGSLAEKSGASGRIYTSNKGAGILDIGRTIPKNQIDYRNTNDVPSLLSLTQNHAFNNLRQTQLNNGKYDVLSNHKIA